MLTIERMQTKIKNLYYQQIDQRIFIQVNFLLIENFIHVYALPFFFFFNNNYIFIQNACYILTSKAQATYEVFHINIFLYN
jgi:hypothetical protein